MASKWMKGLTTGEIAMTNPLPAKEAIRHCGKGPERYMNGNGHCRGSNCEQGCDKGCDLLPGDESAGPSTKSARAPAYDPLWTPEQVAQRLNVSPDWVRDHSSRKQPRLPVIRLGGGSGRAGLLRYRASEIEKFIAEMEHLSRRTNRSI